jgi:hypothetical protein
MPKKQVDFDTVRKIGLALPGVEESTTYGSPALKVRGKLLACIAINKAAEPNSLVVRVDFDQRAELLETDPQTYYMKDHYVHYPSVLVRLSRIQPDALKDLLLIAWRYVTTQPDSKKKRTARRLT